MARFTFKLPDIGEGISEAEVAAWHVAVGDRVEEDQPIADMMTDKATVVMESPVSGVVVELAGVVGDQVSIGAALVVFETDAVVTEDEVTAAALEVVAQPLSAAQVETAEQYEAENPGVEQVVMSAEPEPVAAVAPVEVAPVAKAAHALASPAVRARARDLGIDLSLVKSETDLVRHADLDAYLRYGSGQGYGAGPKRARADEAIRVIGMRRRIAENMAASKRSIPHFTYVDEIDVTALEAMRADLNDNRGERPKLTMLPLLIAAICKTIPDFPMLNARYDDQAGVVTRFGAIHLGMATQTDAGLMVPVIRDAQDRNVWQLATEIGRLAEAARTGTATSAELSGSTLTVTSLGPLGGIATTPVINRPEVAIIGPNKIVERPVFAKNAHGVKEIRKAKLMNLSISCDHRVVDGWDAASFVQGLKRYLETPVLLFAG
ncbi:dihydrolipoamide acetyltransferase component of pyruvate dehydrogenase complex [Polymorphobacter glacialis]|uniref:Dihydrolipoamide acetyltransferase component of pyruvate dehydrogenase complex n=1 Tax=Sandarakinorhabdus glacialis TaxID=1614636 RepID=A0A916ZIJ5_9SPHN|nr:dihydrolipoamide acetyltransferase family protein [Polymorphobacter glacialis]GGD99791.1 dihydrolipoamide acetyltransferase component of pyruvate dehydrogenase complex [Polymorphobacter glacialis]